MTGIVDVTTEFADVNGVGLFTRTVGDGPDVVVLHGGPGAHHDYLLPQYDDLASARRLRYYDQRGGGQSPVDRDTDVGWRAHVDDLDALLDHWHTERATILGYSWGALLAMLFAIKHPDRVARLGLVSPAAASIEGRTAFELCFAERSRQLSHPNVAGIYGVEEQEGQKYLILEYVEGETLADRLDRGPLAVEDTLEIAIEIAAGVETAHEAGIVHRDLKPDNIMITPEGRVKVLDFGLARTTGASSSSSRSDAVTAASPTPRSPTQAGPAGISSARRWLSNTWANR